MYQWCYHADNHRVCGLRLQGLGYIPPIIHVCLQHQPTEETDETPFFLTYGHKPVTLPDVALLTPMIQSKSEDSYQEQLIGLIRTA